MRLEIQMPVRIEVTDYHEFNSIRDAFRLLSKQIKVKEVGFNGKYLGMAYIGSLKGSCSQNELMYASIVKESKDFDNAKFLG